MNVFAAIARLIFLLIMGLATGSAHIAYGEENGLHGQNWAFGHSRNNTDALWQKGIGAKDIARRATPQAKNQQSVDTSTGINRALNGAEKDSIRGSLGMSMTNQSSSFMVTPGRMRADEFMPRDTRHVVRAFADVKAGEDLDISVGPELILRDENKGAEAAHEKQPDSALGVGMQFKLDF